MIFSPPLSIDELNTIEQCSDMDAASIVLGIKEKAGLRPKVVATQVDCRHRLRRKLPEWIENPDVFFPSTLAAEQCSSERTAIFRAGLVSGSSLLDLSGGLGVDCFYMSRRGSVRTVYVEQNPELCDAARWNFRCLHAADIDVVCCSAEDYLDSCPTDSFDVIFIDPSRRSSSGKRVYGINDCSPDVTVLAPRMLSVAKTIVIKLSSMLDVNSTVKHLPCVKAVYVVGTDGECKDLVVVLDRDVHEVTEVPVLAVMAGDSPESTHTLAFSRIKERAAECPPAFDFNTDLDAAIADGLYILDPNAVLMKVGFFNAFGALAYASPVSRSTHLFFLDSQRFELFSYSPVNETLLAFVRAFRVVRILPFSKQSLADISNTYKKASVVVRNFPQSADDLRKRMHLGENDDTFVFAFTTANSKQMIAVARRC